MDQVVVDADAAADDVHATEFGRPEDVEVVGQMLYVANTSEDRVVQIDLTKQVLSSFVHAGDDVPVENRSAPGRGDLRDLLRQGPADAVPQRATPAKALADGTWSISRN